MTPDLPPHARFYDAEGNEVPLSSLMKGGTVYLRVMGALRKAIVVEVNPLAVRTL